MMASIVSLSEPKGRRNMCTDSKILVEWSTQVNRWARGGIPNRFHNKRPSLGYYFGPSSGRKNLDDGMASHTRRLGLIISD